MGLLVGSEVTQFLLYIELVKMLATFGISMDDQFES